MTDPYYSDDMVTLYHGDCREVTEWLTADVLVTDPPYGMAYVSNSSKHNGPTEAIAGDGDAGIRDWLLEAWGDGRPALVFGTWRVPRPAAARALLVWDKGDSPGMGDLKIPWGPSHEEVYVLGGGFVGKRQGGGPPCEDVAGRQPGPAEAPDAEAGSAHGATDPTHQGCCGRPVRWERINPRGREDAGSQSRRRRAGRAILRDRRPPLVAGRAAIRRRGGVMTIPDTIESWHTTTPVLAEHCQTPGDPLAKRCLICHRIDQLVLVTPGWGGVWACRNCKETP